MSTRFLPTREGELDNWLNNFSAKISAAPGDYALSAGDAAEIAAVVSGWHAAYETATAPSTRTRGTVLAKREQKRNAVAVARSFAALVRGNDAVPDTLKLGLGLKLRNPAGAPVPVPTTQPSLELTRMLQGLHELRGTAPERVRRRGKPEGAAALLVFRAIGDGPTKSAEEAQYLALVAKGSFMSTFTPADRGKTATYFARWTNAKGEAGPWSLGTSAAIAA